MAEMFGIDISGLIADAMSGQLFAVTVTRYTEAAEDPDDLTGGGRVPTVIEGAEGFWEDFTGNPPPGVTVELNDRKAVLIGDTVPAGGLPQRGDAITIEGQTLYAVQLITRDPASAVYVYQCRDRRGADGV